MSREPTIQARLLASPPVFFGTWGIAAWSLYQVSQQDGAWPLLLLSSAAVAAVMKADAQMKSYKDWKRDWDQMGGGAAALPRNVKLGQVLGLILTPPLVSILLFAGQHGGVQAVLGVLLIFGAPVIAMAGLVGLWRRVRRGHAKRSAQVQPVSIAVRRELLPVPSLSAAYLALPPYCQHLLKGQH